jgi:predicted ATPase
MAEQSSVSSNGAVQKFRTAAMALMAMNKMLIGRDSTHQIVPELAERGHPLLADADAVAPRPCLVRCSITGGPSSGKTTSLAYLTESLAAKGYQVYCVPEAPTLLINGGAEYPGYADDEALTRLEEFESALMSLQISLEESFLRIARSVRRPTVVLFDRGVLDVGAYLPARLWQHLLRRNGWTSAKLCARYDLVLHLVTAASGAEQHYTTENNAARRETPAEARELDLKILAVWSEHKRRVIVDNNHESFGRKLEQALQVIVHHLDSLSQCDK